MFLFIAFEIVSRKLQNRRFTHQSRLRASLEQILWGVSHEIWYKIQSFAAGW